MVPPSSFGSVLKVTTMAHILAREVCQTSPCDTQTFHIHRPCQRCGKQDATLEPRQYPQNRAVALFCQDCGGLNRDKNGRLFIPHRELLAVGIDPDALPKVRHPDDADGFLAETADLWPGATVIRDTRPNSISEGPL
jgi:hypothetical protein